MCLEEMNDEITEITLNPHMPLQDYVKYHPLDRHVTVAMKNREWDQCCESRPCGVWNKAYSRGSTERLLLVRRGVRSPRQGTRKVVFLASYQTLDTCNYCRRAGGANIRKGTVNNEQQTIQSNCHVPRVAPPTEAVVYYTNGRRKSFRDHSFIVECFLIVI